jgi:hypothetical protein
MRQGPVSLYGVYGAMNSDMIVDMSKVTYISFDINNVVTFHFINGDKAEYKCIDADEFYKVQNWLTEVLGAQVYE